MTTSTPSVWLTLKAKDAPALIEYYVDTFGFLLATATARATGSIMPS